MKKIYLLFFFFNLSLNVNSQIRFDSLYDFYDDYEGANSIIVEPTFFLIGGVVFDTATQSQKLGLLNLDLSGNVLYKKSYGNANAAYFLGAASSFVKTYDGGYMFGGSIQNTAGLQLGMLMKLNANGDSLWTRFYGDSLTDDFFYQVKQTRDSGFIGVGLKDVQSGFSDIYIVKTDNLGNEQWHKTLGSTNFYEAGLSIQQTWDDGFVIGSGRVPASLTNYDVHLLRLDSAGNIKWQRFYGGPYDDYNPCIQINAIDTSYILATNHSRGIVNGKENSVPWFMKVNDSGTTIWSKEYSDSSDFYIHTALEATFDGNYIAVGQGDPTSTFGPNVGVLGRIFKISPQGDSLWYRSYYHLDVNCTGLCDLNYFRDIKPTPDGGYIACGWVTDVGFQDMWVIKMDSMGCVDTLCIIGVGVPEYKQNVEVSIYPNPAHDNFTVSAPLFIDAVLTVNDFSGRLLFQQAFNKEVVINIAGLKAGMYIISLQNEKERSVVKFVKE